MICALEAEEFNPYGRQYSVLHPGSVPQQLGARGAAVGSSEHGMPLHKAIKELSIKESGKKDFWRLKCNRRAGQEKYEEELYVNDHLVVWSKGTSEGTSKIIKSFTLDSPVHEALWCSFLIPIDQILDSQCPTDTESKTVPAKCQNGVCVVQSNTISIFTTDGRDYSTTLPFQISTVWPIKNGLLMERVVAHQSRDAVKTPKKDQSSLPVLFSMLHPLDEAMPVICKTGGASGKVSFVSDMSQQIVFTCEDPSLLVTYDKLLKAHSIWFIRAAKPEEAYAALGPNAMELGAGMPPDVSGCTPGSTSGFSRLTASTHSPSYFSSPLLRINCSSQLSTPSGGHSKLVSPLLPKLSQNIQSRQQSPSLQGNISLYRLQTPSPQVHKSSPVGSLGRTPMAMNGTFFDKSIGEAREPLVPEICLDHLWTEGTSQRIACGGNGQASKVFLIKDLCGKQFLCYLVTFAFQLRCVKFNKSNDKTQLIFGTVSNIQARDAADLQSLNMILVLDMNYHLILYSGTTKINQVHVGGLPDPHNLSSNLPPVNIQPSTPYACSSSIRLSLGPVTSSRPPSAMDARFFNDEMQHLSPVPTEYSDTSQVLDNSLNDEISFHMSHLGQVMAIRDSLDNSFTLELSDGRLFRTTLPPLAKSPIIQLCLDAMKQILTKDLAMQVMTRWYSSHNAPGSRSGQSEWQMFVKCLLSLIGYDVDKLALTRNGEDGESSLSPVMAPKKKKVPTATLR